MNYLVSDMEIRIFTCPNVECGFNVSETHFHYARYDLDCPRCRKHRMSEFKHRGLTYGQIEAQTLALSGKTIAEQEAICRLARIRKNA